MLANSFKRTLLLSCRIRLADALRRCCAEATVDKLNETPCSYFRLGQTENPTQHHDKSSQTFSRERFERHPNGSRTQALSGFFRLATESWRLWRRYLIRNFNSCALRVTD